MSVTTSTFGGASLTGGLKKTIDELFHVHWNKKPFEFEKVFKVSDTDEAFVDDVQIQYPSEIETVSEGGAYGRVDLESVRSKRYTVSTCKGELKITQEMLMDAKYGLLTDGAEALALAARRTVERRAASFFGLGFSSELAPDGLSVFNTAHTLNNPLGANPTTFSNRSTGALNATNLKLRRSAMMKTRDEHGDPAPYFPSQLIVGPDLIFDAKQLKGSALEPGTANNDKNVAADGLEVVQLTYLMEHTNGDTMWFLRDGDMARNRFFWRMKPQSETVRDHQTGDYLYRIMFRFTLGCSDWRGLDGSLGTT